MSALSIREKTVSDKYSSKLAGSYMDGFTNSIELLCRQVYNRRLWFSDNWTDTEAGKGKEIKMLEYACGPGAVSGVCMPYLHDDLELTSPSTDAGPICDQDPWSGPVR